MAELDHNGGDLEQEETEEGTEEPKSVYELGAGEIKDADFKQEEAKLQKIQQMIQF